MRCINVIAPLTITLLLTPMLGAQKRPQAEEILAWFPFGSYESIIHIDLQRLQQAELFPLAEEMNLHLTGEYYTQSLPEALRKGLRSLTIATLLISKPGELIEKESGGLSTKNFEEQKKAEQEGERGGIKGQQIKSILFTSIGENHVAFENVGGTLWILRYDLLDPTIERAEKEGLITRTGDIVDGRSVYKLGPKEGGGDKFVYPTATQELLIAERKTHLLSMIATGYGQDLNILDDWPYVELLRMVPDLGDHWRFHNFRITNEYVLLEMRKIGASSEEISEREEQLENGSQYAVRTCYLDDQIVEKEFRLFGDQSVAKRALDRGGFNKFKIAAGTPPKMAEFLQLKMGSWKNELDGTMLISTLAYDVKLINSFRTGIEEVEKLQEEQK